MAKIQNMMGSSSKAAVAAAKDPNGPRGEKVSHKEWKAIEAAVERDLQEATLVPIGAPYPSDPLMAALAKGYVAVQRKLVSARTENAAQGIHEALSSIGKHSAEVVKQWLEGKRDVRLSDKQLGTLLQKVEDAQKKTAASAATARAELEPLPKVFSNPEEAPRPAQAHADLASHARASKLGFSTAEPIALTREQAKARLDDVMQRMGEGARDLIRERNQLVNLLDPKQRLDPMGPSLFKLSAD